MPCDRRWRVAESYGPRGIVVRHNARRNLRQQDKHKSLSRLSGSRLRKGGGEDEMHYAGVRWRT